VESIEFKRIDDLEAVLPERLVVLRPISREAASCLSREV
jgi:hypothetical protein